MTKEQIKVVALLCFVGAAFVSWYWTFVLEE
jgi:hypothetical protein